MKLAKAINLAESLLQTFRAVQVSHSLCQSSRSDFQDWRRTATRGHDVGHFRPRRTSCSPRRTNWSTSKIKVLPTAAALHFPCSSAGVLTTRTRCERTPFGLNDVLSAVLTWQNVKLEKNNTNNVRSSTNNFTLLEGRGKLFCDINIKLTNIC